MPSRVACVLGHLKKDLPAPPTSPGATCTAPWPPEEPPSCWLRGVCCNPVFRDPAPALLAPCRPPAGAPALGLCPLTAPPTLQFGNMPGSLQPLCLCPSQAPHRPLQHTGPGSTLRRWWLGQAGCECHGFHSPLHCLWGWCLAWSAQCGDVPGLLCARLRSSVSRENPNQLLAE
jgi:hypothetical protein